MASASGELGPRSEPLVTSTSAACLPSSHPECRFPSAEAIAPPLVHALDCNALVVELPKLPTSPCDASRLAVGIEAKQAGRGGWNEVRRDVTAGTVTLGGLDALDVYQFRVVLHRDGLPDHVGTASALAVPEDADSSTLSAAPAVAPLWERRRRQLLPRHVGGERGDLPRALAVCRRGRRRRRAERVARRGAVGRLRRL